jgi:hypothetical protein
MTRKHFFRSLFSLWGFVFANTKPRSPAVAGLRYRQGLNPLSKIFKNYVADQSGKDGNTEVGDRENVFHGESQALALAIGLSKFTHQKI